MTFDLHSTGNTPPTHSNTLMFIHPEENSPSFCPRGNRDMTSIITFTPRPAVARRDPALLGYAQKPHESGYWLDVQREAGLLPWTRTQQHQQPVSVCGHMTVKPLSGALTESSCLWPASGGFSSGSWSRRLRGNSLMKTASPSSARAATWDTDDL